MSRLALKLNRRAKKARGCKKAIARYPWNLLTKTAARVNSTVAYYQKKFGLIFSSHAFLRTLIHVSKKMCLDLSHWKQSTIDALHLAAEHFLATLLEGEQPECLAIVTDVNHKCNRVSACGK